MNRSCVRSYGINALMAFLAVATFFFVFGVFYGQLLLPLFRWEIGALFPFYRVLHLTLAGQGNEIFFTLQSVLSDSSLVGTTLLPAGTRLTGSTLLGHALQHPVILLSMTGAAWLIQRENGGRLLFFSFLCLLAVELVDVPLVLIGSMDNLLLEQFAPGGVSSSLIIYWMNFLNEGGRLVLSIVGGIVSIWSGLNAPSVVEGPAGNGRLASFSLAVDNVGKWGGNRA